MAGGLGFLLGAFYDVFRVIRLLMRPSAKVVFFQDLLFFALSSVVTFLFALAVTGGELRFYLFLGLVTGFMAYYFTIGRAVVRCGQIDLAMKSSGQDGKELLTGLMLELANPT